MEFQNEKDIIAVISEQIIKIEAIISYVEQSTDLPANLPDDIAIQFEQSHNQHIGIGRRVVNEQMTILKKIIEAE